MSGFGNIPPFAETDITGHEGFDDPFKALRDHLSQGWVGLPYIGRERKERPIIFNTEMVKAILDGRKVQTRRVIKPSIKSEVFVCHQTKSHIIINDGGNDVKCPYGKPGDLLYVRETWMPASWSGDGDDWCIHYKANGPSGQIIPHLFDDERKELDFWIKISDELREAGCPEHEGYFEDPTAYLNWKPSIFMPKTAARIWLEVNNVRVQRVQDITTKDIMAEGLSSKYREFDAECDLNSQWCQLWDSINKDRGFGWDKNPWVWVVDFRVISKTGRPEGLE